ncbi:MAG: hypothetical protein N4A45_08480 [Flavobacteriales bacterium]|jgi:hypothetical protein|nr:hypothetical protein [Flavobacteriales bacterium]
MTTIRFTINFQTKIKRKLEKYINLYEGKIGHRLIDIKINRYHKIDNQFQADFKIETSESDNKNLVYTALILANKLWDTGYLNWKFVGPFEDKSNLFECILNNKNDDQPLKWAHIQVEKETKN